MKSKRHRKSLPKAASPLDTFVTVPDPPKRRADKMRERRVPRARRT